jgi:ABC-2 type transport system permease protein
MLSMRRFGAIVRKEFIELFRDRRTLLVMILMPIAQLTLFTVAIQNDLSELPIGWIDTDATQYSREIREKIDSSEHFKIFDYSSLKNAENELSSNRIKAIVVIPSDFETSIVNVEKAQVQLLIDGSDPNLARTMTGYFQAMLNDYYLKKIKTESVVMSSFSPPLDVRVRILFNENLSTQRYMIPGLLAYILAFLTLVITSLAMVKEFDSGTFEQLFVTPVTKFEVIAGKLLPFGVVAMFIGSLIALTGYLAFGVGAKGSVVSLVLVGAIFSMSTLAGGLWLSSISQNTVQATQVAVAISIPTLLLSGFMYPVFTMPYVYQIIAKAFPITYALIAMRGIYLKGWGFFDCLPYILIMSVFAVAYLALTVRAFNRRVG